MTWANELALLYGTILQYDVRDCGNITSNPVLSSYVESSAVLHGRKRVMAGVGRKAAAFNSW
jgi:hypothetical protein